MSFVIRPARPAEHFAVCRLWKASWDSIGISTPLDDAVGVADLAARLEAELAGGWTLYVADLDRALAGMLALDLRTQELSQLFVAPDKQGCGAGSALLAHAKGLLPGGMWLSTAADNARARAWYEREGFVFERTGRSEAFQRDVVFYRWPGR